MVERVALKELVHMSLLKLYRTLESGLPEVLLF